MESVSNTTCAVTLLEVVIISIVQIGVVVGTHRLCTLQRVFEWKTLENEARLTPS